MFQLKIFQSIFRRKTLSKSSSAHYQNPCYSLNAAFLPIQRLRRGFTLIEMLCIIAMIAIILSAAGSAYLNQLERAKINRAINDIKMISKWINEYLLDNNAFPDSLNDIGFGHKTDPWGNPYQYLRIEGGDKVKVGHERKVYSAHDLNTDFDLFSMGKDGKSAPPLTAQVSQDDVLRLDNGAYLGLGSVYQEQASEEKGGGKGKGKKG